MVSTKPIKDKCLAKRKARATKNGNLTGAAVVTNDSAEQLIFDSANTTTGAVLQELKPQPALPVLFDSRWMAADAAVVGTAHLRSNPPKPCQDAALSDTASRAIAVLADGAGSAVVSHIGAAAVVTGVRRLCRTLEKNIAAELDEKNGSAEHIARQIVAHAKGILDDLAETQVRDPKDFRCTLLVWLVGKQHALWLKVGDGALVAEIDGECHCIGPVGKGEFANQTCFIDPHLENNPCLSGCGTTLTFHRIFFVFFINFFVCRARAKCSEP